YVSLSCLAISGLVFVRFGLDAGALAVKISWVIWSLVSTIEFFYKKKNVSAILWLLVLILASYSLLVEFI
ncbi:MAG: hypothetical protein VB071_04090, partial [Lawsonibacter sp.]|nr:hypothetical protein [Lawsonibacter sp.]